MKLNKILSICLIYKLVYLFVGALVNIVFEDFDSSAWLRYHDDEIQNNKTLAWTLTLNTANAFNKWDSVYFNHISKHGYTYEQMLAFYPAFPYIVSFVVLLIQQLSTEIPQYLLIQLTGIIVNTAFQILATAALYKLTEHILKDDQNVQRHYKLKSNFVTITTLAFIFNPASVFMTSSYTESLFVATQFTGLLLMEYGYFAMAAGLVGVSTLTRSNGILNVVFLLYFVTRRHIRSNDLLQKLGLRHRVFELFYSPRSLLQFARVSVKPFMLMLFVYAPLCLLPFLMYQYIVYRTFCKIPSVVLSNQNHWCNSTIPFSYSYIQSEYWNVGFLRYYQVQQIPNFLLALPICALTLFGVIKATQNTQQTKFVIAWIGLKQTRDSLNVISLDRSFVYVVHVMFLLVFGWFNVHVQILTRMLCSSSPVIYWTVAELILNHQLQKKWISFVVLYFISYNCLGLFLHCNFYPWT